MKEYFVLRIKTVILVIVCITLISSSLFAQDLDPRAYVRVPIKTTTLITGFVYSYGGVVTDPTLPIQNIKADVQATSLGLAHAFNFFGLTSQALIAVPYTWAQVSGEVGGLDSQITRSGFGDMRMRFSVLFHGAPAASFADFRKAPPKKTILGTSINIIAPTGQFFSNKLINLGTNRWSFRPEFALSQTVSKHWILDVYTGVWFFTNNNSFYPGTSFRKQDPMGTLQSHFSYIIKPTLWMAFDATFYYGGTSTLNDVKKDDRQSNARFGFTAVVPSGKFSSFKFAASRGAIVRFGQNFTTFSMGWQHSWIPGLKPSKVKKS